ncbi:hypothetical protein RJ640_010071, partial [Escallonia rubra]
MARSLCVEKNCFLNQYGERANMHARFNFYPRCPRPDLVLGLKPHADGSAITILMQEKQVEVGESSIIRHALLVNAGDQLEIMSNGLFKIPMHRVLTNSESERCTLAMFCTPESEKEIEPVEELVDDKRPRLYKKVKHYVGSYF